MANATKTQMTQEFQKQLAEAKANASEATPDHADVVVTEPIATVGEAAAEIASMDIYAFMPAAAQKRVEETAIFLAPPSFLNADGTRSSVKLRKLSFEEISQINNEFRTRDVVRGKNGRVETTTLGRPAITNDVDGGAMTDALIAESLVFPNLKSRELMQAYGVLKSRLLVRKIFNTSADYNYMARLVSEFNGLGIQSDDDKDVEELLVDQAKN